MKENMKGNGMKENEDKKTFGAYILKRRKELGMTQKQFAQQLYVTESAVSKWERGLSYPDITLVQSICAVLQITEHELLSGGEDTQMRTTEMLAQKYQRLTRNYRITQYAIYGLILAGCAVGNLISGHTLDWFFIALAGVMMAASLTLVPALAALHPKLCRCKAGLSFGGFTVSLEILLLVCCIYSRGDWFAVAGISVLFGLTLVFLPFLLPNLPFPVYLEGRKLSVYLVLETGLLLLLLLICCVHTGGDWFAVAAVSVLFGLGFVIFPVLFRQLPLPEEAKSHGWALYFFCQTVLLIAVVAVSDLWIGSKTFWNVSLPVTIASVLLPWGLLLAIRYLPANGWFRAAAAVAWSGVWVWLFPLVLEYILYIQYGGLIYNPYTLWMWTRFDFTIWESNQTAINVFAIILMCAFVLTAVLTAVGIWSKIRIHKESKQNEEEAGKY